MTTIVSELIQRLTPDPWREAEGFSTDINAAHESLFTADVTEEKVISTLNGWISQNQPCLFGRVAALLEGLSYCVLLEHHLRESDESIAERIQGARRKWKSKGYAGLSSAFIIAVISPSIAVATPNSVMMMLAQRLCQLYLVADDILADVIYTDTLELAIPKPGGERAAIMFDVGVNFFSAQADKRWWRDHRFPGGLAFSTNAVGHLVKSGLMSKQLTDLSSQLLESGDSAENPKLDSLAEALRWAMLTIRNAAETQSGKATHLLPLNPAEARELPPCPIILPKALAEKNYCTYAGYYHTDITLPTEYFRTDVLRPEELDVRALDFTYLFDNRLDNPSYTRIASGVRVRGLRPEEMSKQMTEHRLTEEALRKRGRAVGEERS